MADYDCLALQGHFSLVPMQLAAIYPWNSSQENSISVDKPDHYFKQECTGTVQTRKPCKSYQDHASRQQKRNLGFTRMICENEHHIQTNLLFPPHYIKNINCFTTSSKLPLESLCRKPQNSKNPCGSMFLNACRLYSLQNGTKIERLEKKNIGYFL